MPKEHHPRHGSMQFWPRVRAKKPYARVRSWQRVTKDPLLAFMGYKAGMTHVLGIDTRKNANTKGEETSTPVTIIECPPMKIAGVRVYLDKYLGKKVSKDIMFKNDKELARKIPASKKTHELNIKATDYSELRLLVYTQPKLAGVGKKRPELFEVGLSGTMEDKLKFATEHKDKELLLQNFFKEGEYVDIHAVTTGKGLQGPVKRFGVAFKNHKTEKGVRRVGSLGPWSAQGHILFRVAHAGQMGYQLRTEYNKLIFKISNKPEEVNPAGAFMQYGNVKSTYIMLKGSVAGPAKRAIIFTKPYRQCKTETIPTITQINTSSKQ